MSSETDKRAREILTVNDMGGYTVPTNGMYPYQWNWDSVFVALGFATFNMPRACEELETLFDAQWDDGFVPHIVFSRDDPEYFPGPSVWDAGQTIPTSGITQPPVAASVVLALWSATTDGAVKDRLAVLFPKLLAWHRWFHTYRVPPHLGVVVITHPWESGRDNSVEWDAPAAAVDVSGVKPYRRRDLQHADPDMRPTNADYDRYMALVEFGRNCNWDHERIARTGPFRVADVGMTMILLRANRDLATLADALGESAAATEIESYVTQMADGIDYLWDSDNAVFCSRDIITDRHSGYVTSASFLSYYADVGSKDQRDSLAGHWQRISLAATYMFPSHDPNDDHFDALRYWRGPSWAVVNYLLAKGFQEQDRNSWAERITQDSRKLIEGSGFHEAFCPMTGVGTGGTDFSWTAAMWLAWCGRAS